MMQKQKDTSHNQCRQFIYIETFADPKPCDISIPTQQGSRSVLWYQQGTLERQHLPLGEDLHGLIYDIWHGFHPDTFAGLAGCILGGTPVVLLGPPLEKLHLFNDPMYAQISSYPSIDPTQAGYLRQIQLSLFALKATDDLQYIESNNQQALQLSLEMLFSKRAPGSQITQPSKQQALASQQVFEAMSCNLQKWWSLIANRGFGKTTLLHLIAQRLSQRGSSASAALQKHPTIYWLTHSKTQRTGLIQNYPYLLPISIEKLQSTLFDHESPRLLIIDECAKLNANILEKTLHKLQQESWFIILASSIDGYEGSGKHMTHLSSQFHLEPLILTKPMRWAPKDPLDHWIKTTLFAQTLLTPKQAREPQQSARELQQSALKHNQVKHNQIKHSQLKHQTLDIELVKYTYFKPTNLKTQTQWMHLMSLAHYRTRPSDLRLMLDAPNQIFFAAHLEGQMIAGLWLSREGPIPQPLQAPILEGKRRLKGHLAPQYAARHTVENAFNLPWLRIVRIAVDPRYQNQGLGSCLIDVCRRQYSQHPFAVSFQPRESLSRFWQGLDFRPITPGFWIHVMP